jgi:hypothetical protein
MRTMTVYPRPWLGFSLLALLSACSHKASIEVQAAPPAAQAPAAAAPQAPKPAAHDVDLKDELDHVVAWLRGTQDLKDGSYGGGVEGTSWVLAVLADCPRKYRRSDGPFVDKALNYLAAHQAADGSIHDASAQGAEIAAQSSAAVMALGRHADQASKAVLAKALSFRGRLGRGAGGERHRGAGQRERDEAPGERADRQARRRGHLGTDPRAR